MSGAASPRRAWVAIAAVCLVVVAVPLVALLRQVDPPPVLGEVGPFTLVDQDEAPAGRETLSGAVHVVNFIFTRCQNICPTLTATMVRLDGSLPDTTGDLPVRLLSLTVDPVHDTPAVLRGYAADRGASLRRWRFLTGTLAQGEQAVAAFLQAAEALDTDGDGTPDDFTHAQRVVLVDPGARLRGVYALDEAGLAALHADVDALGVDWRAAPD